MGIIEVERERGRNNIFLKTVKENSINLMKDVNWQIQLLNKLQVE
jgi:hypothetical protein